MSRVEERRIVRPQGKHHAMSNLGTVRRLPADLTATVRAAEQAHADAQAAMTVTSKGRTPTRTWSLLSRRGCQDRPRWPAAGGGLSHVDQHSSLVQACEARALPGAVRRRR
jgi:hypothetical protein